VAHEFILEAVEAALKERNSLIASKLSLTPNSPDVWGKDMYQQAADILEQYRPDWENLNSPVKKDDVVEIPAGITVGVVPFGGYITTQIVRGTLASTESLIGGSGYMERGRKRPNSLFRVTVSLGEGEGTIDLLVPSWRRLADDTRVTYTAVLQKPLANSPIAA
jgi:hypothetical protein